MTTLPTPVLKPGIIYCADNMQRICLHCAGASAKFTGHDISGRRVTPIPRRENAKWRSYFGEDLTCEAGCTSYAPHHHLQSRMT